MSEQTPSGTEGERDAFPYEGAEPDGSGTARRSDAPPPDAPSPAEGEGRDRYARARGDEEPGAHSGGESQARERVVPGTASAAEGYRTEGGTAHGDPLAGVEGSEAEGAAGRSGGPEGGTAEGGEDPRLVTRDHVRELLAARDDGSTLVVLEGRARVVSAGELGSERYAGAVEVMSGEELTRQVGQEPHSEQDLDALAARLETMISNLGG